MKNPILFLSVFLLFCSKVTAQIVTDPGIYSERRGKVMQNLPKGSAAVFLTNPVYTKTNDVTFEHKPSTNLFYLTGIEEHATALVLFNDPLPLFQGKAINEILFVPGKELDSERWNGPFLSIQEASKTSGVEMVLANKDFEAFIQKNLPTASQVYFDGLYPIHYSKNVEITVSDLQESLRSQLNLPTRLIEPSQVLQQQIQSQVELNQEEVNGYLKKFPEYAFLLETNKNSTPIQKISKDIFTLLNQVSSNQKRLTLILSALRQEKDKSELEKIFRAIEITIEGQEELMKVMVPEMNERQVEALQEFVFSFNGALDVGYPSIVGGGHNGCILHYTKSTGGPIGDKLVLMDLGAEYQGYTADLTRTIPGDGTFSPEQKAVYNLVLKAQNAAIEASTVGQPFFASRKIAQSIIDTGLVEIGVAIEPGMAETYLPHGISHYIGLDVHDLGTYGNLKPNDVITIEPGIYIPKGSPCDPKWWGIAVRIEDNILITEDGPVNLSASLPNTVEEIEKTMELPSMLDAFVVDHLVREE
jgi:Xaa-Pro aminopeptidase